MIRDLSGSALLLLAVAACGSGGSDPPPLPPACPANSICMAGAAFYTTPGTVPPSVTVNAGTPVVWRNLSGVDHNVTFTNPAAAGGVGGGASGDIGPHRSGTNSRVFVAAGAQAFQCTLHSNMTGTVVVQ